MLKRTRKSLLILLMFLMMLATLTACGKDGDKGEETAKNTDTKLDDYEIDLGYYNCDHMVSACIGEAAGIFEDMGLKVRLTGNGNVPEAMAAGKMDAGYIGNRGMITANGKGSPIVIGANNHIGGSMYLVVSDNIKNPEDLYGKKVAIGSPSRGEGWLAGYSKKLGLSTKDEDYDLVNIGSDSDKHMALSRGQIDAYTACDPWGSMAEYDGSGRIMETYMEMDDKMGICCAFSLNKKFIEEHPEHAVKLLEAHQESVKYCYEHPLEAAKIFAKYYKVPEEVALKTMYMKCVNEGRTLTWQIEEDSFKHAYDVYERYDLIDILPDFKDLIAYDIYEKAELDDFDEFIEKKIDESFPLGMTYEDYKLKAGELEKASAQK